MQDIDTCKGCVCKQCKLSIDQGNIYSGCDRCIRCNKVRLAYCDKVKPIEDKGRAEILRL